MKINDLAMDIVCHKFLGISVSIADYIDEDGKEVASLTIFEYEEPRTAERTIFYQSGKEIDCVKYIGEDGKTRVTTPLDYKTFTWVFDKSFLYIYDGTHKYEFDLNTWAGHKKVKKVAKKSDVIIAS